MYVVSTNTIALIFFNTVLQGFQKLFFYQFIVVTMSIEAKMGALSLGDEAAIIAAIKAEGVEKSGFASGIDVLKAKCASSVDTEALAGLATTMALAKGCPEAEAFNKECLTACKFANCFYNFERKSCLL